MVKRDSTNFTRPRAKSKCIQKTLQLPWVSPKTTGYRGGNRRNPPQIFSKGRSEAAQDIRDTPFVHPDGQLNCSVLRRRRRDNTLEFLWVQMKFTKKQG